MSAPTISADIRCTLRAELEDRLPGRVADADDTRAHSHDTSDGTPAGVPLALVYPERIEDVQAAVKFAAVHKLPVVPQGALTSVTGSANALDGAILINTSRYNRILEINEVDQTATAQAGVIVGELAAAVRQKGLFYPPDPASLELSTIGGNVATDAGGMACVKYGVTKDFVRQLRVVLADGEILTVGHRTVKGVSGLDLCSLFVGSEGTLGVVCEVTVGLRPLPAEPVGLSAVFERASDAYAAAAELRSLPFIPSALEYLDGAAIEAIRAYDPHTPLPAGAQALLLVQADDPGATEASLAAYRAAVTRHGATQVREATDPAALEELMAARRLLHDALQAVRGASLNEDIAVPLSRLPDLLEGIEAISRRLGTPIAVGGHIGDGNLHPVLCYTPGNAEELAIAQRGYREVIGLAVSLGGVVSGEHGIGQIKLDVLNQEIGTQVRDVQHRIKRALDPHELLNPGRKY